MNKLSGAALLAAISLSFSAPTLADPNAGLPPVASETTPVAKACNGSYVVIAHANGYFKGKGMISVSAGPTSVVTLKATDRRIVLNMASMVNTVTEALDGHCAVIEL